MNANFQLPKSTVFFHWLIAFAMIGSLIFGLYLEELPRSPDKRALMGLHKSIGVLILLFALLRIVILLRNKLPPPLADTTHWQQKSAIAVHIFLLCGTLLMPISGIMMSIGGGNSIALFELELIPGGDGSEQLKDIGRVIHGLGSKLLILVIMLHIVAALKHELIDKDGTLKRMLGVRL